mmetsp:Transcript_8578/g.28066  ORF Transcript_8578/g.28066 Transcript_8578/m.28066 type:complete len:209 (-) Transcript_8578:248-874(-)
MRFPPWNGLLLLCEKGLVAVELPVRAIRLCHKGLALALPQGCDHKLKASLGSPGRGVPPGLPNETLCHQPRVELDTRHELFHHLLLLHFRVLLAFLHQEVDAIIIVWAQLVYNLETRVRRDEHPVSLPPSRLIRLPVTLVVHLGHLIVAETLISHPLLHFLQRDDGNHPLLPHLVLLRELLVRPLFRALLVEEVHRRLCVVRQLGAAV